ncbi:stress-induced-phosphoprotein 1-like [Ylistrum balloti]|uniref:stress-induced-phosphoprotein 1-like n=1 Tax=Ylistrum balloti TaxID=509963 RepID=UPI002905AF52|nr:stress-induced-phosphoprotein 1-like [Ylistrum balloti]
MADVKAKVNELKLQGNKALEVGDFDEAIQKYTDAITLDPSNHVLYSNRSAALTKATRYLEALGDADKTLEIKPDWFKGYSRKGAALRYLNRYQEAAEVYEEGLKVVPDNQQLKDDLKEAKSHLTGPSGSQPIGNPFSGPDVMAKLEANPKTREYLKQPDYKMMIELLRQNPNSLQNFQDPRIITTLGVLMGFDLEARMGDMDTSDDAKHDPKSSASPQGPSKMDDNASQSNSKSKTSEQNSADSSAAQALAEKEAGNAAYKSRKFEEALMHYDAAIELDPTNISFRTNSAAVHFEQKDYDKCIAVCEEAVNVGRENRVDYTMIAKALARIGKAYLKKEDDSNALRYFQKSLAEHRTPDVAKSIQEIEKRIKERERLAFIDPEKSLEAKALGNQFFQKGDYPTAKKHYDEAIKRNPEDAKIYSNRAACYTKLMEFSLALKDAEMCIKLDPTFVKGYLRKGGVLQAMKEFSKAATAYQKALEVDPKCEEASRGYREALMAEGGDPEAVRKRAMADPEVQQILADPAMQLILQQMQKEPEAVREHLKNPEVAKKIEKLLESGIIAIR